jgi:UDPglucose 6-dehydrogenase
MKISVVGVGYVGLVTGTCLAEMGNEVVCIDVDQEKINKMQQGHVPIYEPDLETFFERNVKAKRLTFTTSLEEGIRESSVIFLALPTPPGEDGSADLSYILNVSEQLGKILDHYAVIVDKSTVPVGTAEKVKSKILENIDVDFDVVSNPEFLREGQAVGDFMKPERVVIGASSDKAKRIMTELYRPFVRRDPESLIITDEASAEMIKYAANAFLATKISFINQISGLCEILGADVEMIRKGIGSDSRIGAQFLYAGPGYGGSCFPKDVMALNSMAKDNSYDFGILEAVTKANENQKNVIPQKVLSYFDNDIRGKRIALWGLAFKDNTDDIRESPALAIVDNLLSKGAHVVAFDPQAMDNVKNAYEKQEQLSFGEDEYSILNEADALVIATNWKEFSAPDFSKIKSSLKNPVIFDGRNLYDLDYMKELGFNYSSIGRRTVKIDEI